DWSEDLRREVRGSRTSHPTRTRARPTPRTQMGPGAAALTSLQSARPACDGALGPHWHRSPLARTSAERWSRRSPYAGWGSVCSKGRDCKAMGLLGGRKVSRGGETEMLRRAQHPLWADRYKGRKIPRTTTGRPYAQVGSWRPD